MRRRRYSEETSIFVGIDLGKSGGFVCINDYIEVIKVAYPPYEYISLFNFMQSLKNKDIYICVEDVLCYYGKGVYSIRYLSNDKGKWEMFFKLLGLDKQIEFVRPNVWQKELLGCIEKNTMKDKALEYVLGMVRDITIFQTVKGKLHDGLVDAFCLAIYIMQKKGI